VPLLPPVTVSQGLVEVAVHPQDEPAETEATPWPPSAVKLRVSDVTVQVQLGVVGAEDEEPHASRVRDTPNNNDADLAARWRGGMRPPEMAGGTPAGDIVAPIRLSSTTS
jgi:hypothetical protein